jgi:hypothetical protein
VSNNALYNINSLAKKQAKGEKVKKDKKTVDYFWIIGVFIKKINYETIEVMPIVKSMINQSKTMTFKWHCNGFEKESFHLIQASDSSIETKCKDGRSRFLLNNKNRLEIIGQIGNTKTVPYSIEFTMNEEILLIKSI